MKITKLNAKQKVVKESINNSHTDEVEVESEESLSPAALLFISKYPDQEKNIREVERLTPYSKLKEAIASKLYHDYDLKGGMIGEANSVMEDCDDVYIDEISITDLGDYQLSADDMGIFIDFNFTASGSAYPSEDVYVYDVRIAADGSALAYLEVYIDTCVDEYSLDYKVDYSLRDDGSD